MTFKCVIDASVAVKLFIAESLSDRATELFRWLGASLPATFHVPDAFYYEVVAVLRKHMLRSTYSNLLPDAAALCGLSLQVTPTAGLVLDAITVSLGHGISIYDAFYVALSKWESVPLVTADERLVAAMSGSPYDVQSLATFQIPLLP